MIDRSHCKDCYNDVYNGQLAPICWSRETATLVPRLLIHIDQAPPYLNVRPQIVPSCYKRQRFVAVKPEAINSKGYWK